jgi:hypothetical protein
MAQSSALRLIVPPTQTAGLPIVAPDIPVAVDHKVFGDVLAVVAVGVRVAVPHWSIALVNEGKVVVGEALI